MFFWDLALSVVQGPIHRLYHSDGAQSVTTDVCIVNLEHAI